MGHSDSTLHNRQRLHHNIPIENNISHWDKDCRDTARVVIGRTSRWRRTRGGRRGSGFYWPTSFDEGDSGGQEQYIGKELHCFFCVCVAGWLLNWKVVGVVWLSAVVG